MLKLATIVFLMLLVGPSRSDAACVPPHAGALRVVVDVYDTDWKRQLEELWFTRTVRKLLEDTAHEVAEALCEDFFVWNFSSSRSLPEALPPVFDFDISRSRRKIQVCTGSGLTRFLGKKRCEDVDRSSFYERTQNVMLLYKAISELVRGMRNEDDLFFALQSSTPIAKGASRLSHDPSRLVLNLPWDSFKFLGKAIFEVEVLSPDRWPKRVCVFGIDSSSPYTDKSGNPFGALVVQADGAQLGGSPKSEVPDATNKHPDGPPGAKAADATSTQSVAVPAGKAPDVPSTQPGGPPEAEIPDVASPPDPDIAFGDVFFVRQGQMQRTGGGSCAIR